MLGFIVTLIQLQLCQLPISFRLYRNKDEYWWTRLIQYCSLWLSIILYYVFMIYHCIESSRSMEQIKDRKTKVSDQSENQTLKQIISSLK